MSQIEHREVIRDDYNVKHYEIIRKDGVSFIYDYGSGRFLEGEEAGAVLKVAAEENSLLEDV